MSGSGLPSDLRAAVPAGRTAFPGFSLRVVARTASTQDLAAAAARAAADAGWCCVAGEQTAGRGRQGRRWTAPAGSALLFSLVLRPSPRATPGVPLAAGLAVTDALAEVSGVDAGLKWPNDVIAGPGKLAGIIAEVEPVSGAVVLGAGINLSVDSFPAGVAGSSLHRLVAQPPSRGAVLAGVLLALGRRLAAVESGGIAAVLDDWRRRAVGLGQRVTAQTPLGEVQGIARDVDDTGALLVDTDTGTERLLAADVHLLSVS
ncbi:MAG: biotin--[acetyl-CoA-carboxylase] ligase [Chloroflexi bacterium]|nr:MAG: biotin--[acetyl-CoA-carboxylase] ligase [Chloroflexota bacterium]